METVIAWGALNACIYAFVGAASAGGGVPALQGGVSACGEQ